MLDISLADYFHFGGRVRYLEDVQPLMSVHGDGHLLANIRRVIKYFDSVGLRVTKRAAKDLVDVEKAFAALPDGHKVTEDEAGQLRAAIAAVRLTLWSELAGKRAYVLTDKRLPIERLTDRVGELFAPSVFAKLDLSVQRDFAEAGVCIAFERPTAAAFHLLRATEAALRSFYCSLVKRGRVDPLLWGPMTSHLRNRRNAPPTPLLNNLDNIRLHYRNPTAHPEKFYDIHEAQDLFSLCIEVCSRMCQLQAATV